MAKAGGGLMAWLKAKKDKAAGKKPVEGEEEAPDSEKDEDKAAKKDKFAALKEKFGK